MNNQLILFSMVFHKPASNIYKNIIILTIFQLGLTIMSMCMYIAYIRILYLQH